MANQAQKDSDAYLYETLAGKKDKPKPTSAQAVSRALHGAGFRTTPDMNHWGMRVRRPNNAGEVHVSAFFESDSQCARLAGEAAEVLQGLGYKVRHGSPGHLYVSK